MKLFALFFFLLPLFGYSQTKHDYERAMVKFQRFYNAGQADSISKMFDNDATFIWNNKNILSSLQKFGTLKSFKFIGIDRLDPQNVYVFKTTFSKAGTKTTSLTLNKNNQLETFRFITSSEGITELLKKNNSK
jgi:hypothetical protein